MLLVPGMIGFRGFAWKDTSTVLLPMLYLGTAGVKIIQYGLLLIRGTTEVAAYSYIMAVTTALCAWLFLGESIGGTFALGTALMLLGFSLFQRWAAKEPMTA